jgi:hypothetical protein
MVFGISLSTYTIIHVIISLAAILAGFIALIGMAGGKQMSGWIGFFLLTTIATSVTGFGFPNDHITPGIIIGILSLLVLAVALVALYMGHLAGPWRWIFVIAAIVAQWFDVFVLVVQSFQKIDFLKVLAPTQSELPFQIVQGAALIVMIVLAVAAIRKFHPQTA